MNSSVNLHLFPHKLNIGISKEYQLVLWEKILLLFSKTPYVSATKNPTNIKKMFDNVLHIKV